jgi:large subunit ribosomal protein L3
MKIDTVHGLIYVKGGVPGTDNAMVKVKDAIKKGWFGKTFPQGARVPFPTCMESHTQRELLPTMDLKGADPFARTKRERT